MHRLACPGRQGADRPVVERVAGLGAAALPLADHVVALGDQVSRAPEVQVREGSAEPGGELPDFLAAAAGGMQRVFEADVGGGEFVDDSGVEVLAPELG